MKTRAQKFRGSFASPIQLAVAAALAGAASAHAQAVAPAARAASAAGDGTALQEVTVTATKRSTSLQSTPVAVTPISAAELEKAHVQTVQDIVHLVPSFQATSEGDHGVITMTMRGIGNDSAKTEYADPEVALFVDGLYAPRAEGAAALLFDMENIEVLRGPQGTLWGRNSTVGAVNMQTAKPDLSDNFGNVEFGLGSYNRVGARGAFNAVLGPTLALRFAFAHEQHDGYVDYQRPPQLSVADQQTAAAPAITAYNNPKAPDKPPTYPISFQPINYNADFVEGGQKYNAQDQTAARLSLLWKPTRNFKWVGSYEKFLDRGTPGMNLLQTPREGTDAWSALISVAPYLHRDVDTFRSRIDYDISDDLGLVYTAGYSDFHGEGDFDQSGGALLPTSFTTGQTGLFGKTAVVQEDRTNWSHYKNYSHEFELQSRGKHDVDWILGAYYAAEDNGIRFDIPISNGTQQGTIGWQGSFIQPKETVQSEAVFGQATWNAGEALHVTGGARFTWDDRKNEGGTNNGWQGATSGAAQVPVSIDDDPLQPGSGFSTYQKNDGHYTGTKATWLGRVNYDLSKGAMVYGSISTGYKSGGLQDGGREYGPETLVNYEVGSKNTLFDGKVHFNNTAYYEDFKDFQFSAPVTNPDGTHSLATSNAQGAKVYGFESELAAQVTKDDLVQLSGAYEHTRLGYLLAGSNDYVLPKCPDPLISSCLDVTGHRLPHAPTVSGQAQYEHTFRFADGSTLAPRISLHYESSSWLSVFNMGDGDLQKSYTRTDLGLRYQAAKDWYLDAFVQNVEDGRVKTNAQNSFGAWQSQYLPPRTFGFNAGYNF